MVRRIAPAAARFVMSLGLFGTAALYRSFDTQAALALDVIGRADALEAIPVHAELATWTAVPGIAAAAAGLRVNLSLLAQGVDLSTDTTADAGQGLPLERDLVRLLRVAPTDPAAWLNLAAVRWGQGRPVEAEEAYAMAALLAPREGAVAAARLPLAIAHWPDLPEVARRSAGRDISMLLAERVPLAQVKAAIEALPQELRRAADADLRAMIGLEGKDSDALGLTP
ncbi:hypothetical protein [Alsobacter sp. R-9]